LSPKSRQAGHRAARHGVVCAIAATSAGCGPNLDILGVYFPGWLVSGVTGLVIAYALVWWLGRRPVSGALAQSGLFFCGLTLVLALVVWWAVFSGF